MSSLTSFSWTSPCPDIDGWEATRRIKADPATKRIPIIALTANVMAGDREKAIAAGCDDFDTKPVELPRLLGKIRALAPAGTALVSDADAALLVVDDIEDNRFTLTPPAWPVRVIRTSPPPRTAAKPWSCSIPSRSILCCSTS